MDWLIPVSVGLIGSFHCAGMCGPIALALPLKNNQWFSRIASGTVYNLGRIITYGLLGLLFGLLGKGFRLAGFQRWISILLGLIMIISVLFPFFFRQKFSLSGLFTGFASRLTTHLRKMFSQRSYSSMFSIGLLNGLLPCGLVYIAVAGSINSGSAGNGVLFMVLFGIGTIPMMLLISLIGNVISVKIRRNVTKIVPWFIVFLGILFILRGMSLGIPYVSPKAEKLVPKVMMKDGSCCK
jgi:uncharacterized protein